MAEQEVVNANEVLQSAGASQPVRQGTFLQRTGLYLASGVGLLATCVIAAIIWKIFVAMPPALTIPAGADAAKVKLIIENYKLA